MIATAAAPDNDIETARNDIAVSLAHNVAHCIRATTIIIISKPLPASLAFFLRILVIYLSSIYFAYFIYCKSPIAFLCVPVMRSRAREKQRRRLCAKRGRAHAHSSELSATSLPVSHSCGCGFGFGCDRAARYSYPYAVQCRALFYICFAR